MKAELAIVRGAPSESRGKALRKADTEEERGEEGAGVAHIWQLTEKCSTTEKKRNETSYAVMRSSYAT